MALGSLVVTAAPGSGQEIQALGVPEARSPQGFTHVFAAAELPDGRVIVTDSGDQIIAIMDFEVGTVDQVGRRGQGPKEYLSVFSILSWPDGSYRVYDAAQGRLMVVSPQGRISGSESFPATPLEGFSAPWGTDARGFVYVDGPRLGPNGLMREAPVFRWDPASGEGDTVGVAMQFAQGQGGRGVVPMPRGDAWSFLPDGSVARVVGDDYHVIWTGGGRGDVVGPLLPHPTVPVGRAERDAWIDALYARPPGGRAQVSGGERAETRRARRRLVDEDRFPEFMPVFDGGYVPAAPQGHLWVRLTVLSDAAHTVFDVLDREGRLARRVEVRGDARLVGFGERSIYLVRKDEVDLEWLERYPYPVL